MEINNIPTVISPEGVCTEISPNNKKDFSLKELQTIVGGYIQIIHLYDTGNIMILDEEGKLKKYPYNKEATSMVEKYLDRGDYIVGNVLICLAKYVK